MLSTPPQHTWQWELSHSIRSFSELKKRVGWKGTSYDIEETERLYPMQVTPYYLSLAKEWTLKDPILQQCIPQKRELEDFDDAEDPLGEGKALVTPRLVHRYRDRALFLTCGCCAMRCRHCMRKRVWHETMPVVSDEELSQAVAYLKNHPVVREVLVSGGDPLVLPDQQIERILNALCSVPSLEMLRIGSRTLVALPQRYTEKLCSLLGNCGKTVWLATHFNHPQELSPLVKTAVDRLLKHGIPVINQSVLLKGINDDVETLGKLFTDLLKFKIKPYYLFHGDPVKGTTCFRTGIQQGVALMTELRKRISGLALPAFGFDLPNGGGKVRLEPNSLIRELPDGTPVFRTLDGDECPYA